MLLYEVNLAVKEVVADAYEIWLREHIREMMAFDGFLGALWLRDSEAAAGERRLVVQYRLRDRASLDAYFSDHAPRMRRDGTERFPDGFTATRRILEVVADTDDPPAPL